MKLCKRKTLRHVNLRAKDSGGRQVLWVFCIMVLSKCQSLIGVELENKEK